MRQIEGAAAAASSSAAAIDILSALGSGNQCLESWVVHGVQEQPGAVNILACLQQVTFTHLQAFLCPCPLPGHLLNLVCGAAYAVDHVLMLGLKR